MLATIIKGGVAVGAFSCNQVDALDSGFEIIIRLRSEREHAHGLLIQHEFGAVVNTPEPETIIVDEVPNDCWLRFE